METLSVILTYVLPALILTIPGVYAAVVATRLSKAQSRQTDGSGSDSYMSAAQKAADLNDRYATKIIDLEKRLEAVEDIKSYQIVVEFQTSVPPQVQQVKIVPIGIGTKDLKAAR